MTEYATVPIYACAPDGFERDNWNVEFRTTWMRDDDTGWEVEARWCRAYIGRLEITRAMAALMFDVDEIETYAAGKLIEQRHDILELV